MRKIILTITLLVTAITMAQNNLFDNISTTDQYHRYFSVQDDNDDGLYEIKDRDLIVKFKTKILATGEGYRIEAVIDQGNEKGKVLKKMDALEGYSTCVGYPYESNIRHRPTKSGFVAIGDYVFLLYKMSESGVSYGGISRVFIKVDKNKNETTDTGKKKKKGSFMSKLKALKNASSGNVSYGAAHKELQSKNLDKLITDYLVAMKAKQDARTAAEKRGDNNLEVAKSKGAEEIKRYNDSIKATPEYKRMKDYQKFTAEMKKKNDVTLQNNSSKDIYVCFSSSCANQGTRIPAGGTAAWNCDSDAYVVLAIKRGSTTSYQGTERKVYTENTGCGKTININ